MLPPPVIAWILHTPLASGVIDMVEYNLIKNATTTKGTCWPSRLQVNNLSIANVIERSNQETKEKSNIQ